MNHMEQQLLFFYIRDAGLFAWYWDGSSFKYWQAKFEIIIIGKYTAPLHNASHPATRQYYSILIRII